MSLRLPPRAANGSVAPACTLLRPLHVSVRATPLPSSVAARASHPYLLIARQPRPLLPPPPMEPPASVAVTPPASFLSALLPPAAAAAALTAAAVLLLARSPPLQRALVFGHVARFPRWAVDHTDVRRAGLATLGRNVTCVTPAGSVLRGWHLAPPGRPFPPPPPHLARPPAPGAGEIGRAHV